MSEIVRSASDNALVTNFAFCSNGWLFSAMGNKSSHNRQRKHVESDDSYKQDSSALKSAKVLAKVCVLCDVLAAAVLLLFCCRFGRFGCVQCQNVSHSHFLCFSCFFVLLLCFFLLLSASARHMRVCVFVCCRGCVLLATPVIINICHFELVVFVVPLN